MKMFGNFDNEGVTERAPSLGGGGPLESGIYTGTVKLAYVGQSQSSSAQSITLHVDIDGNEYRETFWVTNKNGNNYYVAQSGDKTMLPGYSHMDHLCLLTTRYAFKDQDFEQKVCKLWNYEAGQEVNTEVMVMTGVIGHKITMGIQKKIVDKNKKDANGKYVPSGETREENETAVFFHEESGRTVAEIRANKEEASFIDAWKAKNEGKTRNLAKGTQKSAGGIPGANAAPQAGLGFGAPAAAAGGAQQAPQNFFGGAPAH